MNDSVIQIDIEEDKIGKQVVDAAVFVHKELGPGLLESVYEACLLEELSDRGLKGVRQKTIDISYKNKITKGRLSCRSNH